MLLMISAAQNRVISGAASESSILPALASREKYRVNSILTANCIYIAATKPFVIR